MKVILEKLVNDWPQEDYVVEDVISIIVNDIMICEGNDDLLIIGDDCAGIRIIPVDKKTIKISTYI